MQVRTRFMSTLAATAACAAVALAGSPVLSPAAAQSPSHPRGGGLSETNYGFQGTAYATRVTSGVGVSATRTAFSYISCTRLAGRTDTEPVVEGGIPPGPQPYLTLGVGESRTRTYKNLKHDIAAAITSTNTLSKIKLGNSSTPRLVINGLSTRSTAWATKAGELKTSNHVGAGKLSLEGITDPGDNSPLGQLFDAVNSGLDEVLQTLIDNGGSIPIPGLGVISAGGFDKQVHRAGYAYASSFVLRVQLYGPDSKAGGGDDSFVGIGRSYARINKDLPAAVMGGNAYGSSVSLVGGILQVGRLGEQVLPCPGTHGVVRQSPGVDLNPGGSGQLRLQGIRGESYGIQRESGAAKAWTAGTVADLTLGSLELKGIVGRVKIAQGTSGRITKRTFRGSSIGQVIVDGKKQGGISPGQASQIPADQLPPQVASIELFKREKHKRALRIVAVTITMAAGSPGPSVIELGAAKVRLVRY